MLWRNESSRRTSYLNALIENSPLAILVLDPEQKVQLYNPAFEIYFYARKRISEIRSAFSDEKALPEDGNIMTAHPRKLRVADHPSFKAKNGSYIDLTLSCALRL